ncbi:MAG: membrane protein insertase YidC [Acidobacteriia bacterium]|nr:membrane protein insertase YidC [Terriglobia bacterium]
MDISSISGGIRKQVCLGTAKWRKGERSTAARGLRLNRMGPHCIKMMGWWPSFRTGVAVRPKMYFAFTCLITCEWQARKIFQFKKDSYLTEVSSTLMHKGQPKPHLLSWRGGFGDETVIGAAASQHSVHFDLATSKLEVKDASAAKEGALADCGNYSFAGIEDSYFAAVALPETTEGFEVHTISDSIPSLADGKEELNAGIAVGGRPENRFSLFVGPKDTDLLRSVSPRLEQLVDWGWLALLAKPLFLVLNWLHDNYIPNYGLVDCAAHHCHQLPAAAIEDHQPESMKNMQVLQPQIAEINARYKGLGMRDPKKANQNQEVMDLYKKHGVNPVGGCIPMVLQIPFFIAFYKCCPWPLRSVARTGFGFPIFRGRKRWPFACFPWP